MTEIGYFPSKVFFLSFKFSIRKVFVWPTLVNSRRIAKPSIIKKLITVWVNKIMRIMRLNRDSRKAHTKPWFYTFYTNLRTICSNAGLFCKNTDVSTIVNLTLLIQHNMVWHFCKRYKCVITNHNGHGGFKSGVLDILKFIATSSEKVDIKIPRERLLTS